ncbi:ATP-binding protein [Candidatus Altiarchaeota archaeon]
MKRLYPLVVIALTSIIFIACVEYVIVKDLDDSLRKNLLHEYTFRQHANALQVASNIGNEISNIEGELRVISAHPAIKGMDKKACNRQIKASFSALGSKVIGDLIRTDTEGISYCGALEDAVGFDSSQFPHIRKIRNDIEHKKVLSRGMALDYPSYQGLMTVLHVPIFINESFQGTIGAAIYFDKLGDVFLKEMVEDDYGYIMLVDDNRQIIYHPVDEYMGVNLTDDSHLPELVCGKEFRNIFSRAKATGRQSAQCVVGAESVLVTIVPKEVFPGRSWFIAILTPIRTLEANIFTNRIMGLSGRIFLVLIVIFTPATLLLVHFTRHLLIANKGLEDKVQDKTDEFNMKVKELGEQRKATINIIMDLNIVKDQLRNTDKRIGKLQDISRMGLESAGFEEADLNSVFEELRQELNDHIMGKNGEVRSEGLPKLFCNGGHMKEVFRSLILNGLGSNESDRPQVTVSYMEDDEEYKFSVRDNGVGIAEDDFEKIFDQPDLASIRHILKEHGGRIWVAESRLGEGSLIKFTVSRFLGQV